MKIITYINAHKILVAPVVLAMMAYFDNWSTDAFVYLGLHGKYSILWLIKEYIYPDRRFQETQSFLIGAVFIFLPLSGYYLAPYLLISRRVLAPPPVLALALCLYTLGIFLHYVGDAQKFYTLKLQKGLIEDGLFARTRNPNYLGEILIYTAFAILSQHWLPFFVIAAWVFGFFLPNMRAKDQSLARYPGFVGYRERSWLLFPKIW